MCVGILTRESIRRALQVGITASQIISFLRTNAHPQCTTSRGPIHCLPVTVGSIVICVSEASLGSRPNPTLGRRTKTSEFGGCRTLYKFWSNKWIHRYTFHFLKFTFTELRNYYCIISFCGIFYLFSSKPFVQMFETLLVPRKFFNTLTTSSSW